MPTTTPNRGLKKAVAGDDVAVTANVDYPANFDNLDTHTHPATDIASGTVATARLGSGSASGTTFLRGDQTWATPAGGGSVATDVIFDAKGDLPAGTGPDTATKLSVGANDTVLVADSAIANGLKWAALLASQIPNLDAAKITTGQFAIARLASGTPTGLKFVRDDGTLAVPAGGSADQLGLTRTAVKTGNYTAVAGDYVPVDTTAGAVTITLPAATAASVIAIKHIIQGSTNVVNLACAGSDVFNKTGGPTTGTLALVNQAILLLGSAGIWTILADDLPLSGQDARYILATARAAVNGVASLDGSTLVPVAQIPSLPASQVTSGTFNIARLASGTPNGLKFVRDDSTLVAPPTVSTDTLWDAKGDLAVGTGADTAAKLTAGTNLQTVRYDSTQTTGLRSAWIHEPSQYYEIFDEFISNQIALGQIGALGWDLTKAGTAAALTTASSKGHPGYMSLTTGSTSTGRCNIDLGTQTITYATGAKFFFETCIQLSSLVTAGLQEYQAWFGLIDTNNATEPGGAGASGVYFYYDQVDTHWKCKTANNNTRTSVTTTTTVDTSFHRFGIDFDATTATFYIDGVSVATSTTNIPTDNVTVGAPGFTIAKSLGSTAMSMNVDYMLLRWILATPR